MTDMLFRQWRGGSETPSDWNGRGAIGRHGEWIASDGIHRWTHVGDLADIMFYPVSPVQPTNAQVEAENKRLQHIIDARPAINAGLPETYIEWSRNLYLLDAIRSAGAHEI